MPKPKIPATIHDVAEHAAVGASTVSKVLNGYQDIAPGTKERVLRSVEALGYTPNRAARSFRTGKTQTASIFLPMIGTEFYDRLVTAIDEELAAHDFDAALFPLLNDRRLERYRAADALPYHADGLIFASLNPDWLFANAQLPVPLPAVLVDAYHSDYDTVTVDNAGGAYAATAHLLERPAATFAVLVEERFDTPFSSGVFLERGKGFRQAMADHGNQVEDKNIIFCEYAPESGRLALRRILERTDGPINVFASCDLFARGVLDEAESLGLEVGTHLRLVGFDDQPWAQAAGLSTVNQPIEEMGRLTTKLLLDRLANPARAVEHLQMKPELKVRASSQGGSPDR